MVKPLPCITDRAYTGFVNGEFNAVRAFRSKKMGQSEIDRCKGHSKTTLTTRLEDNLLTLFLIYFVLTRY